MLAGVETDGFHLRDVRLAVRHHGFLDCAVDNLANDIAVILVHGDKLAFKDKRQLVDNWRIHKLALRDGETALRHLVGRLVAAHDAKVVARLDGVRRAEGDSETSSSSHQDSSS